MFIIHIMYLAVTCTISVCQEKKKKKPSFLVLKIKNFQFLAFGVRLSLTSLEAVLCNSVFF